MTYQYMLPYIGKGGTSLPYWAILFVLFKLLLILALLFYSVLKRGAAKERSWCGPVSVIVPAYNEEENIRATLTSILNNVYGPLEIIVMDDGSSDSTASVVRSVQKNFSEMIRLITIKNGGKAAALNRGIHEASHEIIVTMDGDTIFSPNTIRQLVRHFSDMSVGGVAGKIYASHSRNVLNLFQHIEYVSAQNMDKIAFGSVNAIGVVPGPVAAWRKTSLINAGLYSTDTLVEDQDVTLAVLSQGWKVVYEPKALAFTETPFTIRDFVKQRFRWIFGTIQCLWKYKKHVGSVTKPNLGFAILPYTAVYTVLLSLASPFVDLIFLATLTFGTWVDAIVFYMVFTVIDMLYASIAFIGEKKKYLLLLLPFQRIFYRFVLYYVIIRSIMKAIEGTEVTWNKVKKRGGIVMDQHVQTLTATT